MKEKDGITWIGLVVFIIIAMILIGIIFIETGSYIIDKAILARERTEIAMRDEKDEIEWVGNYNLEEYEEVVLKENVEIGNYIEYPFEYRDIYTGKYYDKWNGWRVLDIDKIEGIKIISVGIPVLWHYELENKDIQDNFEEINLNLENKIGISGRDFKVNGLAKKVETLSLADLNYYCNKIYGANREEKDISVLNESYEIFYLKNKYSYYWLSTKDIEDEKRLYYVIQEGIKSEEDYRLGIRAVVTLNDNLVGAYFNGVWKYVH